jgi:hypothetical protein
MRKMAIIMTALTLAVLMGCNTGMGGNEENTGMGGNEETKERVPVSFSSGINADRAVGTEWQRGDAIGVFMLERGGTGIADNTSNRKYITAAGNGSFVHANGEAIYYPADGRRVEFIAYYPYAGAIQGFAYPVDVSSQTKQAKIDLMTADRVNVPGGTNGAVALTFKHRLSRVELEIKPGANLTGEALEGLQATITGQRVRGNFDINTNTFSPLGEAVNSISLKMAEDGKSGEGIILPAAAQSGRLLLFTLGSKQLKYTIPADNEFRPGTRNKYTITLKSSAPASSPEEADISVEEVIDAVIEDWGEGVVETGGAEEPEPEPFNAEKTITIGYDRGTVTLIDEAGETIAAGIILSKAENDSITLKAGGGFEKIVWYLNGAAFPGQTFTLKAMEQDIKIHSITFTGWRNGSYLSSESILCTVTP